ncbi:helix-turn-helix domain-containing protein [Amycolatopsis plumensis]|uniref:Helix-turn-helix domain-containing protein n=1 Tax=Amycolatopsis plumensis TaxID=236508 RepID=A0ABV5U882_9PSEU
MKATSSTPRARTLAAGLRELRESHGMGLRKLARILGFAPQLLSLWEKGLRVPPVAAVALILGFFKVSGEQQKHLLELADSAREPDWITSGSPEIPAPLSGLLECERTATTITNWALNIIPGLLQTADYARTLLSNSNLTIEQADARIKVRLGRQQILTRPDPARLKAMIYETALREPVGGEDIMSDQFDHLLEMSRLPNVSLRIVRSGQGYHPGLLGSFLLYEYHDLPPVIFLEYHGGSAFLSDEHHVATHRRLGKLLSGIALSEEASRDLIAEVAR